MNAIPNTPALEAERRLASELFHADADRLVAQAQAMGPMLEAADRKHAALRQYAAVPAVVSAFGALS